MRPLFSVQGDLPDYLIVGLGNHGERYKKTRQNIGCDVTDHFLKTCAVKSINAKKRHWAIMQKCLFEGQVALFIKPQMFMENSGMHVEDIMHEYRIKPGHLIVIHDEVNLKIGEIKAAFADKSCEHRGVRSIIEHIGSANFLHIRIGVGPIDADMNERKYLLSEFADEERDYIMSRASSLREFFTLYFYYGFEKASELLND